MARQFHRPRGRRLHFAFAFRFAQRAASFLRPSFPFSRSHSCGGGLAALGQLCSATPYAAEYPHDRRHGEEGKWFIDSGMRRGTPKADHENVITVYGGTDGWKQRVGFNDATAAYLILIDPHGRVAWRCAGSLDEQRYKALSSEVSRLLSANGT